MAGTFDEQWDEAQSDPIKELADAKCELRNADFTQEQAGKSLMDAKLARDAAVRRVEAAVQPARDELDRRTEPESEDALDAKSERELFSEATLRAFQKMGEKREEAQRAAIRVAVDRVVSELHIVPGHSVKAALVPAIYEAVGL